MWTHLSKIFPKTPRETREVSNSSCPGLPLLPLALLPRAVAQEVPAFCSSGHLPPFRKEHIVKRDSVSLLLPSPSPAPSLPQCCSPPTHSVLLQIPVAQEASFLSLPVKPAKPSRNLLSLVSPPWRTLPGKVLLFHQWLWHRVSQAKPTPTDNCS